MQYFKYLVKKGNRFLISKLFINSFVQVPYFLSGILLIWFNFQYYKKVRILMFILLNVLTSLRVFISKTKFKYSFYVKFKLNFIFHFINIYLSNVDISVNKLFLNKGQSTLEVILVYNKFPIIQELDSFFEQAMNLLAFIEENMFILKLYINTKTLIGGETFLRIFKLPILLTK